MKVRIFKAILYILGAFVGATLPFAIIYIFETKPF